MMRWASFLILSVSLHAAALAYPVSFDRRNPVDLIQVTILPIEQAAADARAYGENLKPTIPRDERSPRATTSSKPGVVPNPRPNPQPDRLPADTIASAVDSNIARVSAIGNSADSVALAISGPVDSDSNNTENSLGGSGSGNNIASAGLGSLSGGGHGGGLGLSGTGIVPTQARYRDTPRPDYPDSARREGREGRVLLRVFVDDQGRSKKIEINSSSGSEALDRAAADAIKRWLFHPARADEQPIESWVNVPIDFHLTDKK